MSDLDFFVQDVKNTLIKDLCERYFNRNFGTIAKSEIDLIMFHHYYAQKLITNNGKNPSDYDISKELGITLSKVRSLRTKDYLQNLSSYDWKHELVTMIEQADFVKKNDDIEILISDVILMMELRNFLEKNKLIDEYVLNPKVFRCSVDVFIKIYEMVKDVELGSTFNELLLYLKKQNPSLNIE